LKSGVYYALSIFFTSLILVKVESSGKRYYLDNATTVVSIAPFTAPVLRIIPTAGVMGSLPSRQIGLPINRMK
jgi:hypothetical protein